MYEKLIYRAYTFKSFFNNKSNFDYAVQHIVNHINVRNAVPFPEVLWATLNDIFCH